jgi:hypothetical protein
VAAIRVRGVTCTDVDVGRCEVPSGESRPCSDDGGAGPSACGIDKAAGIRETRRAIVGLQFRVSSAASRQHVCCTRKVRVHSLETFYR